VASKKLSRQLLKVFATDNVEDIVAGFQAAAGEPEGHVRLAESLRSFLEAVDRAYEQADTNLSLAQHSLEVSSREVEGSNRELRLQNRKISDLLHNLRQGVFTIDSTTRVVAPISRFTDEIFSGSIVDQRVQDTLFADLSADSEEMHAIETALATVFGEEELQWNEMRHLFPQRVTRLQGRQILHVSQNPIWDEQKKLSRIMFVIEDCTALEELDRTVKIERAASEKTLTIMQEFLRHEREQVVHFMRIQSRILTQIMQSLPVQDDEQKLALKRDLHTLKGNFRMFGLTLIARCCHNIEVELRKDPAPQTMLEHIETLKSLFDDYAQLLQKLYGKATETDNLLIRDLENQMTSVPKLALDNMLDIFHDARHYFPSLVQSNLNRAIDRLFFIPLSTRFSTLPMMVEELARTINRQVEVHMTGDDSSLPPKAMEALFNCTVQILRNAVDHGLEDEQERVLQSKPKRNRIDIKWLSLEDESVILTVKDDGAGVNTEALYQKAKSMGLIKAEQLGKLSHQQKLDLIFLPELSGRDAMTQNSGAGLGLHVVWSQVQSMSGTVKVNSMPGEGTSMVIKIPAQAFYRWASMQEANTRGG
jgi:signal transduction histidine kinase